MNDKLKGILSGVAVAVLLLLTISYIVWAFNGQYRDNKAFKECLIPVAEELCGEKDVPVWAKYSNGWKGSYRCKGVESRFTNEEKKYCLIKIGVMEE